MAICSIVSVSPFGLNATILGEFHSCVPVAYNCFHFLSAWPHGLDCSSACKLLICHIYLSNLMIFELHANDYLMHIILNVPCSPLGLMSAVQWPYSISMRWWHGWLIWLAIHSHLCFGSFGLHGCIQGNDEIRRSQRFGVAISCCNCHNAICCNGSLIGSLQFHSNHTSQSQWPMMWIEVGCLSVSSTACHLPMPITTMKYRPLSVCASWSVYA